MNEEYINKDGVKEKPKQYYFFMQYWNLPRLRRTIPHLHTVLKDNERKGLNEYPTPSKKTLYNYWNKFEWDKRITDEICKGELMSKRIDDNLNEYNLAQRVVYALLSQLKGMEKHLDWQNIDLENKEEVKLRNKIQKTYNETSMILLDYNVGLNEMISNSELMKDIQNKGTEAIPFEELLSNYDKDDE